MSSEPSDSALTLELRRYDESLIPEGIEALAALWAGLVEGLSPDLVAEFVAERMGEEAGDWLAYKRVLHPRMRVGRSPLLAALHRHRSELRAGGVETLFRAWNIELRRLTPPQIAGEVHRRLASDECASYRRSDDPIEAALDRVFEVISRFEADLIPTAAVDLTRIWGGELVRYGQVSQVIEGVVQRLSMPAYMGYLKPGRSMPKTGEQALKAALDRYPDLVPSSSLASTYQALLPLFKHMPPARVAGLVAEKLGALN